MSILFAPCQLWPNFVDFLYLLCMLLLVTITNSDNTNTGSLQLTPTTQQKLLRKLENARTVPISIWRWICTKLFLWVGFFQKYFYEADLDKRRMFSYLHFYEKQSRWCQTNISNKKASNLPKKVFSPMSVQHSVSACIHSDLSCEVYYAIARWLILRKFGVNNAKKEHLFCCFNSA